MGKLSLEIKWGFLFAAVALVWMFFEKSMGWHGEHIDKHANYTLLFMPLAILIYVLALRDKRNTLGGTMTWKEGFIAGMMIALIVAILSPLSQYIIHNIISPDYFPNVIKYSVDNGFLTQDQAEASFNLKSYMTQAIIGAIGAGAFTSAIVAFILKSR